MLDSHLDCVNSTAFPATCAFIVTNLIERALIVANLNGMIRFVLNGDSDIV